MTRPAIRLQAERLAARRLLPLLALGHLLALIAARTGGRWTAWARYWAAAALAVACFLLVRDYATGRRKDRYPDIPSSLAWGAAAALEIHVLFAAVGALRLVPAALFPSIAYLRPWRGAAVYAAVAAAWLSWSPGHGWPSGFEAVATLALAIPGFWAGWAVRNALDRSRAGVDALRKAVEDGRSLLLPWEGDGRAANAAVERLADAEMIRWREEADEGIRRVLEGVLPMAGADAVLFVRPSSTPGGDFMDTVCARGGTGLPGGEISVPDPYVPVREATVFGRPFLADGDEAGGYPLRVGGRVTAPSGVAAVPVPGDGKPEGAVLALRFGEGGLAEPALHVLDMGAFFAAREIAASRRLCRVELSMTRQKALQELVSTIAGVAELGKEPGAEPAAHRRAIYRETAVRTLARLDASRVLLIEANQAVTKARLAVAASGPDAAVETTEECVPFGDTYAAWVVRNGARRMFSRVRSGPFPHPVLPAQWSDPDEDAFLLVPFTGRGGFRGLIACTAPEGRSFGTEDAEVAGEFVKVMTMGLSHARRVEDLERDATEDGLTGLLNQKSFRLRLASKMGMLDGRHPFAVVMMDLDHFKRVNDTHGHPAGDEVLRKCSGVIRKTIRKLDFAGRYGGEEFVIYLAHTDREHAVQVAERLRRMIRQVKVAFGGKEIGVTASFGVACGPDHGRTAEEILARADEALYRSKSGGRDRVTAC